MSYMAKNRFVIKMLPKLNAFLCQKVNVHRVKRGWTFGYPFRLGSGILDFWVFQFGHINPFEYFYTSADIFRL